MTTKSLPRRSERRRVPADRNGNRNNPSVTIAPPRSRVRLPELAVGLFVTVGFALGAVLWHLNSVTKVPALALASSVERGETIAADDLRVVYLASDNVVARLDDTQIPQVVGRVALIDLPVGTLLSRGLVADAAPLEAGEGVAGLFLEPGQYPALGLAPGDRVNVVRTVEGAVEGGDSDAVLARGATVFAVEDLASDRKLVSIMTEETEWPCSR